MDAATRREEIENKHLAASLGHLHDLLTACKSADPSQIDQALRDSTSGHPDGRFLAAGALSEQFLQMVGLPRAARDIAEDDFLAMLPTWALPLFGGSVEDYASRQAAAREFLLAFMREDWAAQFAITDRRADDVLHALAELMAHILQPAAARPEWMRRVEGIPVERMLQSTVKYAAVLSAACRRDPDEVITTLRAMVGDDLDERWLLASAMATGIALDMDLESRRGTVPPTGPQVDELLAVPPQVTLGDPDTHHHRMIITRRFLGYYLGEDYAGQMAMTDKHGDMLLLGMAEWSAAVRPEAAGDQ